MVALRPFAQSASGLPLEQHEQQPESLRLCRRVPRLCVVAITHPDNVASEPFGKSGCRA